MASSPVRAGTSALLLAALGAGAVAAAHAEMPATAALCLLVAAGLMLANITAANRAPLRSSDVDGPTRTRAQMALRAVLDQSPTPLLLASGATLAALNRSARRLFEVEDHLADPPPALLAAIEAGASVTLGIGGASRTFAVAVTDIAGFGRVASLIDIGTDLRIAEAETTRHLILVLSHEVMNALTPIASLAQTALDLAAETRVSPALVDALGTVARRAESLARFATAYRDLARLPPPARAPVRISVVVDDLARAFVARWEQAQVVLSTEIIPVAMVVSADVDQLSAALWALLQNATEACVGADGGGSVALRVEGADARTLFTIVDTGPGVRAADRERIFDPFFSTRAGGSGVGLPLARQIFRAHGGELALSPGSDFGGAQFVGRLPGGLR